MSVKVLEQMFSDIAGDTLNEYAFGDNHTRIYHKDSKYNIVYQKNMPHLLWCIKSFVQKKITPDVIAEVGRWFDMCISLQVYHPDNAEYKAMYFDKYRLSKWTKNKIYDYVGSIVIDRKYAGDGYYSSTIKDFDYGVYGE